MGKRNSSNECQKSQTFNSKKDQTLSSQSPKKSITLGSYYSHRIDRHIDRAVHRQAGRWKDRQTDLGGMDGQKDRQITELFLRQGFSV